MPNQLFASPRLSRESGNLANKTNRSFPRSRGNGALCWVPACAGMTAGPHVICHRAIAQSAHAKLRALLAQHVPIRLAVAVNEKHVLPVVAARGDNTMRQPRFDHARLSRQEYTDTEGKKYRENRWLSPICCESRGLPASHRAATPSPVCSRRNPRPEGGPSACAGAVRPILLKIGGRPPFLPYRNALFS